MTTRSDTDAPAPAAAEVAAEPIRRCIATRLPAAKGDLIRFVIGPDGAVTPDLHGRLPGRGLYVAARAEALNRAIARNLFAKASRGPARVPDDLYATVQRLVQRQAADLIAMARRAGAAVAGYEKVRAALEKGNCAALLVASDGSDNAKSKLRGLARALEVPNFEVLDAQTLGAAFGRPHVVHAALFAGRMADRVVAALRRVIGLGEAPAATGGIGGAVTKSGQGSGTDA